MDQGHFKGGFQGEVLTVFVVHQMRPWFINPVRLQND
jgi:hypothetical protein